MIGLGVALFASGGQGFAQETAVPDDSGQGINILLRTDGVETSSPKQLDSQAKDFAASLQHTLENYFPGVQSKVEVAVFAIAADAQQGSEGPQHPGQPRFGISFGGQPPVGGPPNGPNQNSGRPNGPPNFGNPHFGPGNSRPPGMRMESPEPQHQGQGSLMHHPEVHNPEGPFAEDRRRIAALIESAERILQAGLPDVAHGLRERAGQLERELGEKQARMQREERERTELAMRERRQHQNQQSQHQTDQRRDGIAPSGQATPPLRELHEQIEQLRRDMHKLSEQMADLTHLIQQRQHSMNDRGRHEHNGIEDEKGDVHYEFEQDTDEDEDTDEAMDDHHDGEDGEEETHEQK